MESITTARVDPRLMHVCISWYSNPSAIIWLTPYYYWYISKFRWRCTRL